MTHRWSALTPDAVVVPVEPVRVRGQDGEPPERYVPAVEIRGRRRNAHRWVRRIAVRRRGRWWGRWYRSRYWSRYLSRYRSRHRGRRGGGLWRRRWRPSRRRPRGGRRCRLRRRADVYRSTGRGRGRSIRVACAWTGQRSDGAYENQAGDSDDNLLASGRTAPCGSQPVHRRPPGLYGLHAASHCGE